MKYAYALSAAALAVGANAQGAPFGLKPSAATPSGWITTSQTKYMVSIVLPSGLSGDQLSGMTPVECQSGAVVFTIKNGELYDSFGRIADVVANRQFQFDGPPAQTGTIYDAGFSIAPNGSLALGDSTIWYQCKTSDFYNIYDQSIAPYCTMVNQMVVPCTDTAGAPAASGVVTAQPQSSASSAASSAGSSSSASSTSMSSSSAAPMTMSTSTTSMSSAAPVVSAASDGQPQASAASNATVTSASPSASSPVKTGGASAFVAPAGIAAVGAFAAFFL